MGSILTLKTIFLNWILELCRQFYFFVFFILSIVVDKYLTLFKNKNKISLKNIISFIKFGFIKVICLVWIRYRTRLGNLIIEQWLFSRKVHETGYYLLFFCLHFFVIHKENEISEKKWNIFFSFKLSKIINEIFNAVFGM